MEPVLVVLSCSSSPDDLTMRDELEKQLQALVRQGHIRLWHGGRVRVGESTQAVILKKIREARIVLPLISPDYLASEDCEHELKTMLALQSTMRVLPVKLRSCTLHGNPLEGIKILPEGGNPVRQWHHRDDAWASVARTVRETVDEVRAGKHAYVPVENVRTTPMSSPLGYGPRGASGVPFEPWRPTPVSPISAPLVQVPAQPIHIPVKTETAPAPPNPAVPATVVETVYQPPVSFHSQPRDSQPTPSPQPSRPPEAVRADGYLPIPSGAPAVMSIPDVSPAGVPKRGTSSGVLGALVGVVGTVVVAALLWKSGCVTLDSPPKTDTQPTPTSQLTVPPRRTTTPPSNVCCAGVDCPDTEKKVANSWCEKFPMYCQKCASGRRRVDGACSASLPKSARYRVRLAQAVVTDVALKANARVCIKTSGGTEPETCATLNEARAGIAPPHPVDVSVADLALANGMDFRIEQDGQILAVGSSALVADGGILTAGLCPGVGLRSPTAPGVKVTIFLDDP
ncbi:MAG: TIR domain-containing protein [Polyangiaceae bacterium]|nr:TIR domain-containing protein [Polyangiaceae bacterium]